MFGKNKLRTTLNDDLVAIGGRGQRQEIIGRFLKNRIAVFGLGIAFVLVLCAMFPQLFTSYDPIKQNLSEAFMSPSSAHWFGTDEYGRDIYARVVYGCRISMQIGLASVTVSCLIGVIIGSIAGFYGGRVDNLLMRGIDIVMAIPNTLLGISIVAALGPSVMNLIIAISIGAIPGYARITKVSVLSVKDMEYVEAAYATGASDARIIFKYILPNCLAPIIVQATMSIAIAIMTSTGLSFLGLGVPAPTPEWGSMASAARIYIRDYWWLVTFPGLAIMAAAFSFNLFGDGLRDALDPKLKS